MMWRLLPLILSYHLQIQDYLLLVPWLSRRDKQPKSETWCVSLCFSRLGEPTDRFCKETDCHLILSGQPQPPLCVNWHWPAFAGTRQGWSLAGSGAAAHRAHFCAHCETSACPGTTKILTCLFPRKLLPQQQLQVLLKYLEIFFSHPRVCEVPRRSPAVQHCIADFFGKA